jgi:ABC-type branched-subunit amino acid transport system substrate-binding protein
MNVYKIKFGAVLGACAASLLAGALTIIEVGRAEAAELLVAHVGPYSGSAVAVGTEYGAGAMLYFEHVNGRGGVNGAKIAMAVRDDAGDPELTQSQATALMPLRPIAFIGAAGTDNINGLAPLLEKLDVPLVGPMVDLAGVDATAGPGVFHIRPNAQREAEALVGHLRSLGFKKIALCDQRDRSGLRIDLEQLRRGATAKEVVISDCGGDSGDVDAAAGVVTSARAQAVILIGQTTRAAGFVKALRARESYAMIVTSSSVDAAALAAMLSPATKVWLAVAENMPNPQAHARHGEPVVQEFLDIRARSRSPVVVSRTSLAGFVTAKILVEAIRRAGANPTGADVLRVLSESNDFALGGMTFNFSRPDSASVTHTRVGIIGNDGTVLN